MGRAWIWALVVVSAAAIFLSGCSESEVNPYDPSQDQDPPVVTSFLVSGSQVTWSTDEPALCVLEYGVSGGDYDHYVYESTKYHSTYHQVDLLNSEDGVEYAVRIRSMDRAGNEGWETGVALPATITGETFDDDTMTLAMIDVGWGLSMALTMPNGDNVLIDAGTPEPHLDEVTGFLDAQGIGSFVAAMATHYHYDHYGGYFGWTEQIQGGSIDHPGVLELYGIDHFIVPDETNLFRKMGPLLRAVTDQGIPITYVKQGDSSDSEPALQWDPIAGVRVDVLSAGVGGLISEDDSGDEGMNTNNDSVMLKITYGGVSFITTGDGEHFSEYGIVDAYGRDALRADILQIAHHGSDDSSSELWLDNVSPRVAFISCAMIEAPLEKEEVLQGIRAVDADYFVTDRIVPNTPRDEAPTYGHLVATTDGATIEVCTYEHLW